jgi:NAD(P)-dependent dehydrogenase (short-subunit alcohol dehydrogenase family)
MDVDRELTHSVVCEYSYAQSKAAEAHMTRLMAAGLSPLGIRVNSVTPGRSTKRSSLIQGLFPSELTTMSDGKFFPVMEDQMQNIPKG